MKPIHIHMDLYLDMDQYQYILLKKIKTPKNIERYKAICFFRNVNQMKKHCVLACLAVSEFDEKTLASMRNELHSIITASLNTLKLEDI